MSKPITIRFGALEKSLENYANREGKTVAEIVRISVSEFLDKKSYKEQKRKREMEILFREIAILKAFTSGIANHILSKERMEKAMPHITMAAKQRAILLMSESESESEEGENE